MTTATATGIRCGNCHHYHESVEMVRKCHQGRIAAPARVEPTSPLPTTGPLATQKQINFLRTLCAERDTTLEHECNLATLTLSGASQLITEMKQRPRKGQAPATTITLPDVHAGRYALLIDGEVKFFKVDRPTEGPWKGRTFVKVQASDEFYPVKGSTMHRVLELIAADPQEAMLRYGREIGACGHCGRTLTNEESRQYGIGPVCRGKMGW